MKDKCIYIRCEEQFIDNLNRNCNKLKCSQSEFIQACTYIINDMLVTNKDIDSKIFMKYIQTSKKRSK